MAEAAVQSDEIAAVEREGDGDDVPGAAAGIVQRALPQSRDPAVRERVV
jgi:hypothetical protein